MSSRFEQEYSRANDRIHPRQDLYKELEQKWAQEQAREEQEAKKVTPFPSWAKYTALAAGILLCIGLGMESMILFGRSKGVEHKTASAEASLLAEDKAQGAAETEALADQEPIHFEEPLEAEAEEAAPAPEALLMAAVADEPIAGTHPARDEAEVEDALRYGADRGGNEAANGLLSAGAGTPKAAKAAKAGDGVQYPRGEVVRREDLLAVFLPTLEQVHVVRFDGRKIENVFSLTLRERNVQIEKVLWLGSELLALREKNGDTELLRFDVADWKAPKHRMNLTQSGTFLGAGELGGQMYVLSLYEAREPEPLPWAGGERLDFDRVLLDTARPGDVFTVLTVYAPGGDGFAHEAALLAKAQGAVADGDRLLLWTEAGDLYAFALTAEGLSLTAERQELGAVLTAQATAAGYALLLQEGNDVRYLALDAALNETASAAARGAGTVLSAQAYGDGGLLLTAESLHYLTASGDKALSLTGDGFRRLAEDRALVISREGLLQLVSLSGDGLEALGSVQVKGVDMGLLLDDPTRLDYDPATGRLVIPAGQNVIPYLVDEAGQITPRGEKQVFYDKDETAFRELRVLLFENQALIFHREGVALCNQYLARQSNFKY